MSDDIIDKEKKIKDTEKLYANLRDVLSKQQDPRAMASLDEVRSALRKREEKLKVRYRKLTVEKFSKKTFYSLYYASCRLLCTLKLIIACF